LAKLTFGKESERMAYKEVRGIVERAYGIEAVAWETKQG